jgi:hypothetical protein
MLRAREAFGWSAVGDSLEAVYAGVRRARRVS